MLKLNGSSEKGFAPIAQLDRAFDYESKGHRFESGWVHQKAPEFQGLFSYYLQGCLRGMQIAALSTADL